MFDDEMTVEAARQLVRQGMGDGIACPCCDQLCKAYPRTVRGTMAYWLIWLCREYAQEERFYHVDEAPTIKGLTGSGDIAKLRYWWLIEAQENDDTKKRCSGYWRPTQHGIDYVRGLLKIKKVAIVYDGTVLRYEGPKVDIRESLGEQFDYAALMEGFAL